MRSNRIHISGGILWGLCNQQTPTIYNRQRFVWVTDYYAIKLILSYEDGNPAILCLQMRLMCWDVDIVHQPDTEFVNADYLSCLGVDLDFNPLFCEYLDFTRQLWKSHPTPTDLPMRPKNMPYYCRPRFQKLTANTDTANMLHIQGLLTDIVMSTSWGHTYLSNKPVRFGEMTPSVHVVPCSCTL